MLTATPTLLLQALSSVPDSSSLAVAGLITLASAITAGAALSLRYSRDGDSDDSQQGPGMAPQPVPTEETERQMIQQDDATPEDHVARQRLKHLTDAIGDNRT